MYARSWVFSFAFCSLLFFPGPLFAESIHGIVVKVLSGDTIEVLHERQEKTVRLSNIYAPISGQPYGRDARIFVSRVVEGEMVEVRFADYDLYGRPIGEVFLPEGTNLNKLIVAAGYAWQYDGFSSDSAYKKIETEARSRRIGLWKDGTPVPPWEWAMIKRQAIRSIQGDRPSESDFSCGSKQYCFEMDSCLEAKYYLHACGLTRLDEDGDGIPCEMKCK